MGKIKTTFKDALNLAIYQEMERDDSVFIYGIGVPDHKKIFGTTDNILERFGRKRCFDTPLSEDALTGFALGAALGGLKPILVHIRVDFSLLSVNQILNQISSFRHVTNGRFDVPIVIRNIIGRGLGQGCQHSKSLQSLFAHIPGLKVVMPTTVEDAKGITAAAIRDNNPVIILEHRWLYFQEGEVEESPFVLPLNKANKIRNGKDLTVIATSWMNVEAMKAAQILSKHGIDIEIIDPRCISELDIETIMESVGKTKKCIIADYDWTYCGFSAEISSSIYSECIGRYGVSLDKPIQRIGFAHTPCPTARHLENEFYPNAINIIRSVEFVLDIDEIDLSGEEFYSNEKKFKGPF